MHYWENVNFKQFQCHKLKLCNIEFFIISKELCHISLNKFLFIPESLNISFSHPFFMYFLTTK